LTPIDVSALNELLLHRPGDISFSKTEKGHLIHALWFAFQLPYLVKGAEDRDDPLPSEPWVDTVGFGDGSGHCASQPQKPAPLADHGREPTRLQRPAAEPDCTAYLGDRVYNWVLSTFDDPAFWVRRVKGVDSVIAVTDNGVLVGGLGPVRLAPARSTVGPA